MTSSIDQHPAFLFIRHAINRAVADRSISPAVLTAILEAATTDLELALDVVSEDDV